MYRSELCTECLYDYCIDGLITDTIRGLESGRSDHTHLALLILILHPRASGLLVDAKDPSRIYVLKGREVIATACRDGTVIWREPGAFPHREAPVAEYFWRHSGAPSDLQVRERSLPQVVPAPCTELEFDPKARLDLQMIAELRRALATNGRYVPALSTAMPVEHLPEAIGAMAFTTGMEIMRIVARRGTASILPWLAGKRKRE